MQVTGSVFVVTGAASGLGRATAQRLVASGARVVLVDLPGSDGAEVAAGLGAAAVFAPADVSEPEQVSAALDRASSLGVLRGAVHCAGRNVPLRVLGRDGRPGSVEAFRAVIETNLIGSFVVLGEVAARLASVDPVDGERGVVVLTASIAAFEGQVGQAPYTASKAGIVGLTLVAARDLAGRGIRVCAIAPGVFDTPILAPLSADIKDALAASVPNPPRLGRPEEFALLAEQIITNPYLNGETIRLDGALRMAPR